MKKRIVLGSIVALACCVVLPATAFADYGGQPAKHAKKHHVKKQRA